MNAMPDIEAIRAQVAAKRQELAEAHGTGEKSPGNDKISKAFQFVQAGELVNTPCPVNWLVSGIIEEGNLACIFGASGSMKSFVAVDIGLCVSTGRDWHGHAVRSPGSVFYVCGEGFAGVGKRLRVWMTRHGVAAESVPFFVSSSPVSMLEPESVETALAAIDGLAETHGAPRLVIVDTLARNFGPGDENSTQDMNAFVAALDSIQRKFGCSVLVVHHTGLATADRARGASAFRAAMDWEYKLESKDGVRFLSCTKSKDHEPPQDMAFEPEIVETGWFDCDGNIVTSVVLEQVEVESPGKKDKPLKGANKIAYESLVSVCTKGDILQSSATPVDVDAWRAEAYSRSISSTNEPGSNRKAFNRAITALRDAGHVSVENELFWPTSLPRRKSGTSLEMSPPVPGVSSVPHAEQMGLI